MPLIDSADRGLWPHPFGMDETPSWTMPWLSPGPVARQALAALPYPLRACETGQYFDADQCYGEMLASGRRLKNVEKAIRAVGNRLEWRLERVWGLDDESTAEEEAAYSAATKVVGGCPIDPRCLDDYVSQAYGLMETIGMDDDDPDWELQTNDPEAVEVYEEALDWARAGVVVLQQSLPWPFTGVLPMNLDTRPAHRALLAYASLLAVKSRKRSKPWFQAILYINPYDEMGVRDSV